MKTHSVMTFCLITAALYFSSLRITYASSSSSSSTPLTGRQARKNLHAEKLDIQPKQHNIKVDETEWKQADSERPAAGQIKVDENRNGNGNGDGDGDELVYHIDYHGISTHPYPTPKHPRP